MKKDLDSRKMVWGSDGMWYGFLSEEFHMGDRRMKELRKEAFLSEMEKRVLSFKGGAARHEKEQP